jgi:hypothetical protein
MYTKIRVAGLFLVALFALAALGSCGGGGGGGVMMGSLMVENDLFSFNAIDYVAFSGPSIGSQSVFIMPGDGYMFTGLIWGYYDVTIGWTDFSTDMYLDVWVPAGGMGYVMGFN